MTAMDLLPMLIADVLRAGGPAAAQLFVTRGMSCPGCPFAPFETVADVAAIYRQDPNELAAALLLQAGARDAALED
jgi:hybrid cluster-associated redox disulfide protein